MAILKSPGLLKMPRVKFAKQNLPNYAHHEPTATFGVGAGPLRNRAILEKSHGKCSCCKTVDDLYGGKCKFCLWMENDKEVGEEW